MWDERYKTNEYAYGTLPNDFLKENVNTLPKGRVLSLAEGEGRNAVFLAKKGYKVTAIDSSLTGIEKGKKLAKKNNVKIEFIHADITKYDLGNCKWDAIVSIFFPLPSIERIELYKKVKRGLKPSGIFLLEAYTPQQIHFDTGGGKSVDLMQSKNSLRSEFKGVNFLCIQEIEREVVEGVFHTGLASVIQAIAKK